LHQLDGLSGMEALLDVIFAIHLVSVRLSYNVVPIGVTIMANVVTEGRDKQ